MKKILFIFFCCFFCFNANANHLSVYLGQITIVDPHTHRIAHKAEDRANVALFVAVGAVALATIGIIKASENNPGQVQIARF